MDSNAHPFFGERSNLATIDEASVRVRAILESSREDVFSDAGQQFMLRLIMVALDSMKEWPSAFDEKCSFNIANMGGQYVSGLRNISTNEVMNLGFLFSVSYRFLLEFQINTNGKAPDAIVDVVSCVHDFEYEGSVGIQLNYAEHQMLISVMKSYIHHPDMVNLKDLNKQLEKAGLEREQSSNELQDREIRVQALREKLETYKTAFNFCGLYDGFKQLRESKRIEGFIGLAVLIALAILMMCPFFLKFYIVLSPLENVVLDTQFYIALLGFEIVLAYFFRVALHNFRSVKAQLMQIDLRMTLCQFVQDYASYAKEVHDGSPNLLEKFEQIVFSGIVNDESAIPSTFDGLENLAGLIAKIKK